MKRVLLMEFLASGTRRNPVMKDITGFDFPDLKEYYKADPVADYLRSEGCEVVPLFVAKARGRMYVETFWQIVQRLKDALDEALRTGPVDGIWFYTYALSAVDFVGNGEEFMLKMIRNKIGYDIPIAIAMDFHGLITPNVAKMVNIVCTFRTNPHTDVEATRLRAARLLADAMNREKPEVVCVHLPMLGVDSTRMDVGAGAEVLQCLEQLEAIPGVVSAALVTGIVWNNVPEGATCLLACANPQTDKERLRLELKAGAGRIWDSRERWVSIDEIIEMEGAFERADAIAGNGQKGVVFLNDSGDNPTGSGVGDSAYMLRAAIESRIDGILVGGIWAEDFLELCVTTYRRVRPGAVEDCSLISLTEDVWVEGAIGAHICEGSTRIPIRARLLALRKDIHGEITGARLVCENVEFLVTGCQEGALDRSFIDSFGIDIESYPIVVLKLGYLVPGFLPYKKACFMVKTPGVTDLDFARIEREMDAVCRPMYPFDAIESPRISFM